MKKILISVGILFIISFSALIYFILQEEDGKRPPAQVTNYEECVRAGGTVAESYPPVCTTKDKKSFTQDIGNELEKQELIKLANPRPGQTITSPVEIRGEARGNWFFEATFPVKFLDSKGNVIGTGHAESEGEWMTTDFVPFSGTINFETKDTKGTLILEKNNPSGLEHNADRLEIPVSFN
jgi:hypothetical protein